MGYLYHTQETKERGEQGKLKHAPRVTLLVLALLSAACAPHPTTQKLTIAAAADLNFALPEIAREFHAVDPAVELEIAYGSSGNFLAQIENRAPFDVFLSADVEYPRRLVAAGAGPANSVFTYAVGRLVVWVPSGSPLDAATAMGDPRVKHVAIANVWARTTTMIRRPGLALAPLCRPGRRHGRDVAGAGTALACPRTILGDPADRISTDRAGRHDPEEFQGGTRIP